MKNLNLTFDSISDYGDYLKALGDSRTEGSDNHSEQWPPSKVGEFTCDTAIACAVSGGAWVEGAQNLDAIEFTCEEEFERQVRAFETGPCGFMPNVPAAIQGLPDSMISITKAPRKVKTISIMVNNSIPGATPINELYNRGRALLSVIDRLEIQGFNVELWAFTGHERDGRRFTTKIKVKAANETTNLANAAFCYCSGAFNRILSFRALESAPSPINYLTKLAYGYPCEPNEEEREEIDVVFGELGTGYNSPDQARITILEEVKKCLNAS